MQYLFRHVSIFDFIYVICIFLVVYFFSWRRREFFQSSEKVSIWRLLFHDFLNRWILIFRYFFHFSELFQKINWHALILDIHSWFSSFLLLDGRLQLQIQSDISILYFPHFSFGLPSPRMRTIQERIVHLSGRSVITL